MKKSGFNVIIEVYACLLSYASKNNKLKDFESYNLFFFFLLMFYLMFNGRLSLKLKRLEERRKESEERKRISIELNHKRE